MHQTAFDWVAAQMQGQTIEPLEVLEIGSQSINGTIRPVFERCASYVGIDTVKGAAVDVVADGAIYEPTRQPDVIVTCSTLEHTPNAEQIVRHAFDILKPGGLLLVTAVDDRWPKHSANGAALPETEYYGAVSKADLDRWLTEAGFTDVQVEDHPSGDVFGRGRKPNGDTEPRQRQRATQGD